MRKLLLLLLCVLRKPVKVKTCMTEICVHRGLQYDSRDKFLSGVVAERTARESRAKVVVSPERVRGETKRLSAESPASAA